MPDPMPWLLERLEIAGERRTLAAGETGWEHAAEFARTLTVLHAEHGQSEEGASPLDHVAEVFGLDAIDAALLWTAAAPDLDASVGLAYGLLGGVGRGRRLTLSLALELAEIPTATPEPFERLSGGGALLRHRLLVLSDQEPWLERRVAVPQAVVATLAGGLGIDPQTASLAGELVSWEVPGADVVARGVEDGVPLVWVRSPPGRSGGSLAAAAFDRVGLQTLVIDLRRHPAASAGAGEAVVRDDGMAETAAIAARDAGLRGCGLVVLGGEIAGSAGRHGVFEALEKAAVPVVVVGAKPWNPAWSARFPLIVEAGPLSVPDRLGTWQHSLGATLEIDTALRETLTGLRLSAEDITEAARYAGVLARSRKLPLSGDLVREAARRVGGSGGASSESSGRLGSRADDSVRLSFDDLVLPDHIMSSLRQFVSWGRHRDTVATTGILRGRGRGIAALFTGNPGTGKTLAAHVIAEELSIDLFQVDLSTIVDKYIGETEKNLERVFQAAEALDVVLFFDEADALFGSRSGVSDARDRYANQEVAYLLQRMEHFDGITILSTNLRGNLDKAFTRRMSFIVHFPDPDVETRTRLWQHHLDQLPDHDPDDPVAVDQLAGAAQLAGGDIRNIVLAAAYDAAAGAVPVGHRHLVAAAVREYRKLGRVLPVTGFQNSATSGPVED